MKNNNPPVNTLALLIEELGENSVTRNAVAIQTREVELSNHSLIKHWLKEAMLDDTDESNPFVLKHSVSSKEIFDYFGRLSFNTLGGCDTLQIKSPYVVISALTELVNESLIVKQGDYPTIKYSVNF
jgi:hypothetical protein